MSGFVQNSFVRGDGDVRLRESLFVVEKKRKIKILAGLQDIETL